MLYRNFYAMHVTRAVYLDRQVEVHRRIVSPSGLSPIEQGHSGWLEAPCPARINATSVSHMALQGTSHSCWNRVALPYRLRRLPFAGRAFWPNSGPSKVPWITFELGLAERATQIVDRSLIFDSRLGFVAIDARSANRVPQHDSNLLVVFSRRPG